jgi:hypothetical protein
LAWRVFSADTVEASFACLTRLPASASPWESTCCATRFASFADGSMKAFCRNGKSY